jgi:hypothetical protein
MGLRRILRTKRKMMLAAYDPWICEKIGMQRKRRMKMKTMIATIVCTEDRSR